jgi:ankyrin repeat protein
MRLLISHGAEVESCTIDRVLGLDLIAWGFELTLRSQADSDHEYGVEKDRVFDSRTSASMLRALHVLVDAGINTEHRCHGMTILGIAIELAGGDTSLTHKLLNRNAVVNAPQSFRHSLDHYRYYPRTIALGIAAAGAHIPLRQILLEAGSLVNLDVGSTSLIPPLILAVCYRHSEATRLLLSAGADLGAIEAFRNYECPITTGYLSLQLVLECYTSQSFIETVLNHSRSVPSSQARNICASRRYRDGDFARAIQEGHCEMISALQSTGRTPTKGPVPSIGGLKTAMFLEHLGILSDILYHNGRTISVHAILEQDQQLVSFLMDQSLGRGICNLVHGLPLYPGLVCQTPLNAALWQGQTSLARIFIDRGAVFTAMDLNVLVLRTLESRDDRMSLEFWDVVFSFIGSTPTAFTMLIESRKYDLFHSLLKAGISPNGKPDALWERGRVLNMRKPFRDETLSRTESSSWRKQEIPYIEKTQFRSLTSALEVAVLEEDQLFFQSLFKASGWTRDEQGKALTLSLLCNAISTFQTLLDAGADVNQPICRDEARGYVSADAASYRNVVTPFRIALQREDRDLMWTLMVADCKIHQSAFPEFKALFDAVESGKPELVKFILSFRTGVCNVFKAGRRETWSVFPELRDDRIVTHAEKRGNVEIVTLLLGARAYVHRSASRRQTPLQVALSWKDDPQLVRELLESGANDRESPDYIELSEIMHFAIEKDDVGLVDFLLEAGANIHQDPEDEGGLTALQLAVKQGNMILVDFLLRAGADVNQKPAYRAGATALQFAAIKGYIGIARKLIDAGADVAAPRCAEHGRTALEGAAEWGRIDILQLLLNEGNFSEGLGRGQLIRAAKLAQLNGSFAAARLLKSTIEWSETDSECYEKEQFDEEEHQKRGQHNR